MATHKYFDKICYVILAFTLVLTLLFMNGESLGIQKTSSTLGYESRLFDTSKVHTINIVMDDWEEFLASCTDEEYVSCTLIIDNEVYKNVAIRAKGNTSLSNVQNYGNDRYSFKVEFDHYDDTTTYYGLDKLSLNNIIQDNTYMKDYLTYQMMGAFGVSAPLCSYTQILVNGEEWGLYLAVEGVEEAFLSRNYGNDYGELYKPDSTNMGGGRGNGDKFDIDDLEDGQEVSDENADASIGEPPNMQENNQQFSSDDMQMPDAIGPQDNDMKQITKQNDDFGNDDMQKSGMKGNGMSSSDVLLSYVDDEYSSYSNIFDNAKTDISDTDKDRLIASLKKLNENSDIEEVVDVEKVIRYFVVHNFVCNFDSYTGSMIHNYYLYEEDGQLSMIPWDYNLAFGGFVGGIDATSLVNYPIDTPVYGDSVENRPMLAWIFENEEYTELYHQYFAEFISQYFDSGYFTEMIDEVKAMISPYVESDPTKFCTYEEFEQGIDTLKEFCLLRAESVTDQLNGAIASTSDEQDEDTLIDASNLSISAMGSMGNGNGGMDNEKGQMPAMQNPTPSDEQNGSMPQMPQEHSQGEDNSMTEQKETQGQFPMNEPFMQPSLNDDEIPQMPQDKNGQDNPMGENDQEMTRPNQNEEQVENQESSVNANSYIMLGICTSVLFASILFALLYKKRS